MKYYIFFAVCIVGIGGYFILEKYFFQDKITSSFYPSTVTNVTLSGVYECLPRKDGVVENEQSCSFGFKTDDGIHYAVNFGQSATAMQNFIQRKRIVAEGFVTLKETLNTDHWNIYDMKGIFTITRIIEPTVSLSGTTTVNSLPLETISLSKKNSSTEKGFSDAELLAMADNRYADGNVPLGDYKYVTSAPKKGYVYLCNVHKDNPGSAVIGPWMGNTTWNFLQKISIQGNVSWPNAIFSNIVSGASRVLSGNDLPINHTTGIFPVQSSDPAHAYDANPNTIKAQTLKQNLPVNPTYSDTPYCMGGEVGIMLSGVALFNAFDAGLRDAPAHELQDSCDGHPQGSGEYHYHSPSACFQDTSVKTVLGYAYDGFPITGSQVVKNKYLHTDNLDVCHGIVSDVVVDGNMKTTYHYVMTQDFPYSASCFRGKPVTTGPSAGMPGASQSAGGQQGGGQIGGSAPQGGTPPQEAINACSGKTDGSVCSFSTPQGIINGVCHTPPNSSLACVPGR